MSALLDARRTYLSALRRLSRWAEERGENGQLAAMQVEIAIWGPTKNKKVPAAPQNRGIVQASTGKENSMPDSISPADAALLRKDGIHVEASEVADAPKPGRLTKAMRENFFYAGFRCPTQAWQLTVSEVLETVLARWEPTANQIKHIGYEVRQGIKAQKA